MPYLEWYFDLEFSRQKIDFIFIQNTRLKKEYETRGYAHSLNFRWDKTLHEYISVLIDK